MTRNVWQLQEAKNKFSEVVNEALTKGPQVITRHGIETVVLLSYAEFRKTSVVPQKLSEFFAESPLAEVELDLARDKSLPRDDIEL